MILLYSVVANRFSSFKNSVIVTSNYGMRSVAQLKENMVIVLYRNSQLPP